MTTRSAIAADKVRIFDRDRGSGGSGIDRRLMLLLLFTRGYGLLVRLGAWTGSAVVVANGVFLPVDAAGLEATRAVGQAAGDVVVTDL